VPAMSARLSSCRFFGFKSPWATAKPPTNATAAIPTANHVLC